MPYACRGPSSHFLFLLAASRPDLQQFGVVRAAARGEEVSGYSRLCISYSVVDMPLDMITAASRSTQCTHTRRAITLGTIY